MRAINNHLGGVIPRLGLGLLLLLQWAVAGEDYGTVNIGAARNVKDAGERTRHVFYQDPTGNIYVRTNSEDWLKPTLVTTVDPRDKTSLSAFYTTTNDLFGLHDFEQRVTMAYIDKEGYIVKVDGYFRDYGWFDEVLNSDRPRWSGSRQGTDKDISAAVMVGFENSEKFYYIDSESEIVEMVDGNSRRLGQKAAKGSNLAAANPFGTSDIHLFYMSDDLSLSHLEYDGDEWRPVNTAVERFAGNAQAGFAAVAWPNPLVIRIFYIDQDRRPNQWVFADGKWTQNPDGDLPEVLGNSPFQPVAATGAGARSNESSIDCFYASERAINTIFKQTPEGAWSIGNFRGVKISEPPPPALERQDKIALGTGIGIGVPGLILALAGSWFGWKALKNKKKKPADVEVAVQKNDVQVSANHISKEE